MKRTTFNLIAILVLSCVALQSHAQEAKRKGFIGISLGPSIPFGEFKKDGLAKTGANISLINFGYLFNGKVGVAANWFGAAHNIDSNDGELSDVMWSYGGIMAGPLVSGQISEDVDLDGRVQIGYSYASMDVNGVKLDGTGFAYGAGAGLRFHVSRLFSLSFMVDAFFSNNKGDYMDRKIQAINPTVGFSYRLK